MAVKKKSKDLAWKEEGGKIKLQTKKDRRKYPPAESDSFTFSLFRDVLEDFYDRGLDDEDIAESTTWFFNKIRKLKYANPDDILKARERYRGGHEFGKMYHFMYQAKHDKKLPYWDAFPLIFPIDPRPGGFLGINLHYLPPQLRIALMTRLYDLAADGRYDKNTKLVISYNILKASSSLESFKPCVKWYLTTQLRSPLIQLYYSEWAMAVALPTQMFQKASTTKVWRDSRKIISGG